ncbi:MULTISPECIES: hypothetical protein [unclassified Tatumella]|uniref:hypothetical protein n=1 Tax=unclassified Tatumella TaxID=2649542 RepID=UPI001BB0C27C|nr:MULTISPECIES: hypothetical protein [unclassified Tatumella]MBS0856857.1 hypothetical protein [Tatumella sp. JGM16]MBS0878970.1 hypothetical protein [Tatumella sp. JGM82]MBS0892273.1 hypothetical protein [Tatumella sp. JGM94]MBS0892435.1 hypothetical protein [Tatumella sp. JGM130]MBS0903496.1 hypothetical protein [Tatumella sp. JGM100]
MFKKIGYPLFIYLVLYWVMMIFLIVFLLSLGIAFIFYLGNDSGFYFDFFKEATYSLSKAVPGGSILGSGLWIKVWLQERKDKKSLSK